MSDPFDELRKVLEAEAVAACAAASIDDLKLPNYKFVQPKNKIWAAFHIIAGMTIPAELGDRDTALNKATGVAQFEVYVPEDTGDGAATRAAGFFRKRIQRKTGLMPPSVGQVDFYGANVRPHPGAGEKGFYCVLCEVTYVFKYRG